MIIVSQDGKAIHNFDNILSLQIEGNEIIVYDSINDSSSIGEYETEERAKEVLNNITEFYSRVDYKEPLPVDKALIITITRVYSAYYMPKE